MPIPRLVRRFLLPVVITAELAVAGILIGLLGLGLLAAVVDRRRRVLRVAAMGLAYVAVQLAGIGRLFALWVVKRRHDEEWWADANTAVLVAVLGQVIGAGQRLVGFRVVVEEPEDLALVHGPDPLVVLARHGGIGDSFALVWLLAGRYRLRPRIVLKEILLWEPLIDVALSRIGACFLPPAGRRSEPLEARIAGLAEELRTGEALLIFPEGANWTPKRRHRAIARLWRERKPEAARAATLMENVLPPRAAGVLACLDARPDVPVVVVAHTGLDRITSPGELWRALPFDTPMTVRWWPPAAVPPGEAGRIEWLTAEWAVVDEWIAFRRQSSPTVSRPAGSK